MIRTLLSFQASQPTRLAEDRRRILWLMLVTLVMGVSGCAMNSGSLNSQSDAKQQPQAYPVVGRSLTGGDGIFLVDQRALSAGADAALQGTLTIGETGCVSLLGEDGSENPVIWPPGTESSSDGQAIVVTDGTSYQIGQRVEMRGTTNEEFADPADAQVDPSAYETCQPMRVALVAQ